MSEIDFTEEIFGGVECDFLCVGVVAFVEVVEDDIHEEMRVVGTADEVDEGWKELEDFLLDFVFFCHELCEEWHEKCTRFRWTKCDAYRGNCLDTCHALFYRGLLHFLQKNV